MLLGQSQSSWPVGPVEHATPMEVLPPAFFVDESELGLPRSPGIVTPTEPMPLTRTTWPVRASLPKVDDGDCDFIPEEEDAQCEVRGVAQSSLWRLGVIECSRALRGGELTQVHGAKLSLLIIINEAYKLCSKYRSGGAS